ncbi:MAG: cation transporter [bacterium]|nr:cation transporter [bacterium]
MLGISSKATKGQELTLEVEGMHCTSCAMNIDGALEDTAGVLKADTSYAHSKVTVQFDPSLTSPEELKKVITEQGYSVRDERLEIGVK